MILSYVWFTTGFCFYGLILNLEHLGGDIFTDSFITFISEIISEMTSGYIADEYGRLIVLKTAGIGGGVSFILYSLISNPSIRSVLIFITSFGFSASFNLVFIYSPEVFPTSIRSTVIGFLFLMSRIGALVVPSLSALFPNPFLIFGLLSIISGYLCFYLEETLGNDILDDIPEIIRQKSFLSFNQNKSKKNLSKLNISKAIVSDCYFKVHD